MTRSPRTVPDVEHRAHPQPVAATGASRRSPRTPHSPHSPRGRHGRSRWWHDDRGEGVISAAIAVLIMAFLGAAMWVGFNQIWRTAETTTSDQVEQIGN